VATLEHRADARGQRRRALREPAEAVVGDAHVGEWVGLVGIEPGGDEEQVGLEGPNRGLDDLGEGAAIVVVAAERLERHVDRRRVSGAGAAAARIERPLVNRYEE